MFVNSYFHLCVELCVMSWEKICKIKSRFPIASERNMKKESSTAHPPPFLVPWNFRVHHQLVTPKDVGWQYSLLQ